MSFLDRFKIQPKYKSADPDVRVAAVAEFGPNPLSEEDAAALLSLAREDADARVRRAAAARVDDAGVLAAIAGSDPDPAIREDVLARLASIAAGDDADAALEALGALTDPRQIANAAKTSASDAVRAAAVERLTDVKSLSSIARHARDPRTAALAADRVQDAAELLSIATKTEHKDAGISALERAVVLVPADRATLDTLATRAENKAVAKRARAMVQAMDAAETAKRSALEAHQHRVAGTISRIESLAASSSATEDHLRDAESDWNQIVASATYEITAADRGRVGAALSTARAALE